MQYRNGEEIICCPAQQTGLIFQTLFMPDVLSAAH